MLMKRLDVTIQSFGWSDKAKVSMLYCSLPVAELSAVSTRFNNHLVFFPIMFTMPFEV